MGGRTKIVLRSVQTLQQPDGSRSLIGSVSWSYLITGVLKACKHGCSTQGSRTHPKSSPNLLGAVLVVCGKRKW